MTDAVADAVQNGWHAPRVSLHDDEPDDAASADGGILDYRVLGYPGGAIVLVVLDCDSFMQASIAAAALAQHLITWSPGLLEYVPSGLEISQRDKPYSEGNWLPPIADEEPAPQRRWPLAELLDENLKKLAGQYLLATAIRAVWHPTEHAYSDRADDIVAGAVEYPWSGQLSHALGVLLIRAARFERRNGSQAKLIAHGSGDLALAKDLLRRARETSDEHDSNGFTDDAMRGHVLVEAFMEFHDLQWNHVPDDDPPEGYQARSDRQLKTLLWAGIRATATLCLPLAYLSGPWQVLDELGGDEIVAVYAAREEEDTETAVEDDAEEVHFAGASHLLVWLAIRHPNLLETQAAKSLITEIAEDTSAFHQIFYATMVMAGHQPLVAALAQQPIPARVRPHINTYAAALAETERNDADKDLEAAADAYDQMHTALEDVLVEGPGLAKRIRLLLATTGTAVRSADNFPASAGKNPASAPRTITYYLLINPSMHSATVLHRDDDDAAIRTTMLCLAAQISPTAAADLSAEFPELTGDDPRLEPAARTRATRWIQKALQLAPHEKPADFLDNTAGHAADAQTLLNVISARGDLPPEWPVHRAVAAAAYTAAAILHANNAIDSADEVFSSD